MERTGTLRDQLSAGLVAGVAGGTLMQAFFFAIQLRTGVPPDHLVDTFIGDAAMVLGEGAYGNSAAVPIGVAVHFGIAIGWALGYTYAARAQQQLLARPWLSGAAFGLVVYVFMQIILIYSGLYHRPPPRVLGAQLIAYIVFYGIPVGLIVARMMRRSAPHAAA